jgi:hypothetical protein
MPGPSEKLRLGRRFKKSFSGAADELDVDTDAQPKFGKSLKLVSMHPKKKVSTYFILLTDPPPLLPYWRFDIGSRRKRRPLLHSRGRLHEAARQVGVLKADSV